jgi:hypothetical protein
MKSAMLFLTATLAAALLPALADARLICPHQISIFGTVDSVSGRTFILRTTESDLGHIPVDFDPSQVRSHGLALKRGVFAGVYGCLRPDDRSFNGEEVTLANSANDYVGSYPRRVVSFDGRITSVASGRALLKTDDGYGDVWVYTNTALRPGQHVRATGSFDPVDSAFVASSVVPL